MALIKACTVGNAVRNSGKECDVSMGPTAMIICVPPTTVLDENDLADPVAWARPLIHADKQSRIYPLFGSVAPINVITNDQEADVEVTLDDGTKVPVRLGVYNRTFETISGGLCYAETLLSFIGAGYRVIEIDQAGRTLLRREDTSPKTWSGIITSYMGGKGPVLATLKDVYRNRFSYSFTPQELVFSGEIFQGGGPMLGLMGLIDAEFTLGTPAPTTTAIFVYLTTHCADSNLVTLLDPADLIKATNFVITDVATGLPVTATPTVSGEQIKFTGTFTAGKTYHIAGAEPEEWYNSGIEGYDGSEHGIDVEIPGALREGEEEEEKAGVDTSGIGIVGGIDKPGGAGGIGGIGKPGGVGGGEVGDRK